MIAQYNSESLRNLYYQQRSLFQERMKHLSLREKFMLSIGALFVIGVVINIIYNNVYEKFAEQDKVLKKVESWRQALPYRLADYVKLSAQKNRIETAFSSMQASGDIQTDVDNLLKSKSSVARQTISIRPNGEIKSDAFSGRFKQVPYMIKFQITDYRQLQEILEKINNQMIIRKIDIIKQNSYMRNMSNGRVNVDLDVIGLLKNGGEN